MQSQRPRLCTVCLRPHHTPHVLLPLFFLSPPLFAREDVSPEASSLPQQKLPLFFWCMHTIPFSVHAFFSRHISIPSLDSWIVESSSGLRSVIDPARFYSHLGFSIFLNLVQLVERVRGELTSLCRVVECGKLGIGSCNGHPGSCWDS